MAIFFGAFANYRRLLLAHYGISYEDYGIAVIKALVLAKVVLVAETLRLGRGYEEKPLIVPTLYKTFLFTVCVAVFDIAEGLVVTERSDAATEERLKSGHAVGGVSIV